MARAARDGELPTSRRVSASAALLLAGALMVAAPGSGAGASEARRPGTAPAAAVSAAPGGLHDGIVVEGLEGPTALAWTPDGRMLVAEDVGRLRVVRAGRLKAAAALDLSPRTCDTGERGLLGLAVDPQFSTNHLVYLYWTHDAHGSCGQGGPDDPVNRVTRHVLGDDDRVVPGSGRVLLDGIPSPRLNHQGGDLHFGANELLHVSVGDGGCALADSSRCAAQNGNSRRLDIPLGKILRVTRDGAVPGNNPYVDAVGARRCAGPTGPEPGTGPCTETFASGLRNPFRFAQVPGTNRFYVNDVGQAAWEEVNVLRGGADYGWNLREGPCATGSTTSCGPSPYDDPIHAYPHTSGCSAVTGATFVPAEAWPEPYAGAYLFSDYTCGTIFRLVPDGAGGFDQVELLPTVGAPVALAFGPPAGGTTLHYLDYAGGAVHRVALGDENTAPVAVLQQRPDGLTVTLDGSASYDPDVGDTITAYRWDFGDGTSRTTTTPQVRHTYPEAGTYAATLTVTDSGAASSRPARIGVLAGQHAPVLSVTSPLPTARFSVGEPVTVAATARDVEDGAIPGRAITWTVRLRHGSHDHPYAGPAAGPTLTTTYPAPEDLLAATRSHLLVTGRVTDSSGLTTTVVRRLLPHTVVLSFATDPRGGRVALDGKSFRTPVEVVAWEGQEVQIAAPDQSIGEVPYVFSSWSDGGARTHVITAPSSSRSWTATFRRP